MILYIFQVTKTQKKTRNSIPVKERNINPKNV